MIFTITPRSVDYSIGDDEYMKGCKALFSKWNWLYGIIDISTYILQEGVYHNAR